MTIDIGQFPGFDTIFLWAIALFFISIFGFGWYANYRQKAGRPIKGVTIKDGDAWVGSRGQGLSLRIQPEASRIRVRWALSNYIIILVALFVFGPGLVLMFVLFPEKVHEGVPMPVWIIVGLIMCLSFVGFAHYLKVFCFEEPMFDVSREGVVLLKSNAETERFRSRDITRIEMEKSSYYSSGSKNRRGRYIDNFTLILYTESGVARRLCITDNEQQISELKTMIEAKLQLTPAMENPLSDAGLRPA